MPGRTREAVAVLKAIEPWTDTAAGKGRPAAIKAMLVSNPENFEDTVDADEGTTAPSGVVAA